MKNGVNLSDGEWKLMKLLWEQPRTVAELVQACADDTGWKKNTLFVMLGRLERKGAVRCEDGTVKRFYPAVTREDCEALQTRGFLERVYDGSVGMMVSAMVSRQALSEQDIDELRKILERAERTQEHA
ncbi:MAG: BlaI/MecI/CopY family transcriptional regulator [Clostridiales bacterium]|nr:BlaI/MecI/CopY family transcriptional regulator [Clostridiales bacterium]